MTSTQRSGLAIMLACVLTRLSQSTGMGEWWNYALILLSAVGAVMLVTPARR